MKFSTNKELIEFAKKLVNKNPSVNVLKPDLMDEYSPLVKMMETQLNKKHQEKRLLLPELRKDGNETIGIFSDYGGESSDSKYYTYTFLVCGWNHSYGLDDAMKGIRKTHGLKDKEIAFKDFGYGPIQRSLDDYLKALDMMVVGYLYTVIVEKGIPSLFHGENLPPNSVAETLESNGFGKWKPRVAEKLARIVHITAYLTALLSSDDQKILWMTDHDSIASNKQQHDHMMKLFQNTLPIYTDNKFRVIGGALPFEEKSVLMLDLLSAADIAAGSIEHYFTRNDKMDELTIKEEANKVLQWLSRDGLCLKKNTILIQQKSKQFLCSEVDIQDMEPADNVEFIGIQI